MNVCPHCARPLGANHACIDITTHGDPGRRYLDVTPYGVVTCEDHVTRHLQEAVRAVHSREVQTSIWSHFWNFLKENW